MAGKSDTFENDLLKLIFNATPIANIADNAATAPLTSLWVSLHTADPVGGTNPETSSQTTAEATYTGYGRVSVVRTTGGWTVATTAGVTDAKPVAAITFPACTGGSSTVTHFAVGTAQTSTGKILYAGAVSPSITVTNGITPQLTTATSIQED